MILISQHQQKRTVPWLPRNTEKIHRHWSGFCGEGSGRDTSNEALMHAFASAIGKMLAYGRELRCPSRLE